MNSQSLRDTSFLLQEILAIGILNLFYFAFVRRRKFYNKTIYLINLNLLFPILTHLAFRDQLDESYVWGSKVASFLSNLHLGVPLYDGKFGESSVSTLQFLIASFIVKVFPVTIEQGLFLPIILANSIIIILLWHIVRKLNKSGIYFVIPVLFMLFDYGYILNLSGSFDVTLGILFLLLIYNYLIDQKHHLLLIGWLVGVGPLIRSEFIVLVVLWNIKILLNGRGINKFERDHFVSLGLSWLPLTALVAYKSWAFGGLVPAMIYFKRPRLDLESIFYVIKYYGLSVGFAGTIFLAITITLKSKYSMFKILQAAKHLLRSSNAWFYLFLIFLLFTPLLAGADYYGPKYQRYLLTPMILCFIILLLRIEALAFIFKRRNIFARNVAKKNFLAIIMVLLFALIASESTISAIYKGDWYSISAKPSRASCDQVLGEALRSFWQSTSKSPLVIATSEANGIAFASGARLLDVSGVVDNRNYPSKYAPIKPGNMYGKFSFKDSILVRKPSILWPYGSEHCQFFNPRQIVKTTADIKADLDAIYAISWSRFWFPSQDLIVKAGYCPKRLIVNDNFGGKGYATFYYHCS